MDVYCPLCTSKSELLRNEDGLLTYQCPSCEFIFNEDEGLEEVDCCICGTHHKWDGSCGVDPSGWAVVYDSENNILAALCPSCDLT